MAVCYRYPDAVKCANCGWNMKTVKCVSASDFRASELPRAEREILATWLPTDIELNHLPVCRECVHVLGRLADTPRPVARQLGHPCVCAACGDAIARARRSQPVDLTRAEHRYIFTECLQPQGQLQDTGRRELKVCRPCVQRAKREMEQKQRKDEPIMALQSESSSASQPENRQSVASTSGIKKQAEETGDESGSESEIGTLVNELKLEGNYNVREKTGLCAVCDKPANQILNLATRQKLMRHRRIYINPSATFCEEHKKASVSRYPLKTEELTSMFTGEEVSDMLFLLQDHRPIDFNKIDKMDPYYLEKWVGVGLWEFERMLKSNKVLRARPDGKFVLCVWLASDRHSDSELASVTERPTRDITAAKLLAQQTMPSETK